MKKNLPLLLAAFTAAVVVFVGVQSFACDQTKTASAKNTATYAVGTEACPASGAGCGAEKSAKMASSGGVCGSKAAMASSGGACGSKSAMAAGTGCKTGKAAAAEMTAAGKSSCASNADWASTLTGAKGYYAANVYLVSDGHAFAVCQGKTFEVTESTPFVQMDAARYYFADEGSKIRCQESLKATVPAIDRETVSLATAEANVVEVENGLKVAQCPKTGQKFVVTADSPARVVDGQKYYVRAEQDLSTLSTPVHP